MDGKSLTSLPNIGNVMARKLTEAGIDTPAKLSEVGVEAAFIRLRALDEGACINSLMALEGALQGVRWHDLDPARKAELREFHKSVRLK